MLLININYVLYCNKKSLLLEGVPEAQLVRARR